MDEDGRNEPGPHERVNPASAPRAETREVPSGKQRLQKEEPHADHPGKAGRDVDRFAPRQQRARSGHGERHRKGGPKGRPDQDGTPRGHPRSGRLQDKIRV